MFALEFLAELLSDVKRQRKTRIIENSVKEENIKSSYLTHGAEIASLAQN